MLVIMLVVVGGWVELVAVRGAGGNGHGSRRWWVSEGVGGGDGDLAVRCSSQESGSCSIRSGSAKSALREWSKGGEIRVGDSTEGLGLCGFGFGFWASA